MGTPATPQSSHWPAQFADPLDFFPASFRTQNFDIDIPSAHIAPFLEDEYRLDSLNELQKWLWLSGRPMPPRALHYQHVLARQIVVTENPDLHLLWSKKRIFIKPLPSYLLNLDSFEALLRREFASDPASQAKLRACVLGFIFSYTALVAHPSDLRIAIEADLLPRNLKWHEWKSFVSTFLQQHTYADYNSRYWYGELRLGRLNLIYKLHHYTLVANYTRVDSYNTYGDFWSDNLTATAGVLGYVVIVLTAMQVGLATQELQPNTAFQNASYGFTVFAILAPLVALGIFAGLFLVFFVINWVATLKFENKRFASMGVPKRGEILAGGRMDRGNGEAR